MAQHFGFLAIFLPPKMHNGAIYKGCLQSSHPTGKMMQHGGFSAIFWPSKMHNGVLIAIFKILQTIDPSYW